MDTVLEAIAELSKQLQTTKNESRIELTRAAKGRVDISVKIYAGSTEQEIRDLLTLTKSTFDTLTTNYSEEG